MLKGFERHDVQTEGATIATFIGGGGPPLLLLHGYPQYWQLRPGDPVSSLACETA